MSDEHALEKFIDSLPGTDVSSVTKDHAHVAIVLWGRIQTEFGDGLKEPGCIETHDQDDDGHDEVLVTLFWKTLKGCVYVDINDNGCCRWFTRDHGAPCGSSLWYEHGPIGPFPSWAQERLKYVGAL